MHIVIGANGLAKQTLPLFKKNPKIIFFDNGSNAPKTFHGYKVINELEDLKEKIGSSNFTFTICIAKPELRNKFFELMIGLGGYSGNLISDKSSISTSVTSLGSGNLILDFSLIETDSTLGIANLINCYAGIFHDVTIGNFNEIQPGAKILGGSKIGNSCVIGTNSVILPGLSICDHVIIGAGCIVTKDITEPGTYVGIPFNKIK
jgi:sugar O-acyltransferase (sialic acid O-acetyltransferase NeuD family)